MPIHLTKKEIFSQDKALVQSYKALLEHQKQIKNFFANNKAASLTFMGAGSSYSLCRSAAISANMYTDFNAHSLAAGDLMMNFSHYEKYLSNTILIAPSRSGNTSEVVRAVKQAKREFDVPCVAVTAAEESDISALADLKLTFPWIYDESVCQTRTVTNLYMIQLFIIGVIGGQKRMLEELETAVQKEAVYMDENREKLKRIAEKVEWEKVVVLGDSELEGIADEAAIAFKEIPRIASNYHHILDVRHGPMVLVDEQTLVIMAVAPFELSLQNDLIGDLQNREAVVCSVGASKQEVINSDYHIQVPEYENYGVMGIPFIYVPQVIAYYKAVQRGVNPDQPPELDSWVEL